MPPWHGGERSPILLGSTVFLSKLNHMSSPEFYRLPTADLAYLRSLLQWHKDHPDLFSIETFFCQALLGYYDCMWSGMNQEVGHLVYRLSDSVPEEERGRIPVYPGIDEGSLILENNRWYSLEDWRRCWEKQNPIIPHYTLQLPYRKQT